MHSFSAGGLQFHDQPLGGPVLDLALGGPEARAWLASEDVVVGFARAKGFEEVRLDPGRPRWWR